MKKTKHTPGPWVIKDLDTIYDKRGIKLCYVNDSLYTTGVYGGVYNLADYRDERNANARLIAAAPELLEALEASAELLKIIANKLGIVTQGTECDTQVTREIIRKAINRARGES